MLFRSYSWFGGGDGVDWRLRLLTLVVVVGDVFELCVGPRRTTRRTSLMSDSHEHLPISPFLDFSCVDASVC